MRFMKKNETPIQGAKPARKARKANFENFPEETEVQALLKAARGNPRDYMFLYLSANLGTRRGETITLSRESMRELDRGYVLVNRLKVEEGALDRVAVAASIADRIKEYMAALSPGDTWLFSSRKDRKQHITERMANYIFDEYKAKAKIRPQLTLHCLRHFKGWKVWRATKNIKAVEKFLGHRGEKNSWIYSHCPMDEQKEIAEDLGEVK